MTQKKYRILDLKEQIEKADKMILLHKNDSSTLMISQYEDLKKRFLSELIEELMNVENLSKYSFKLIYLAINKYYPELIKAKKNEKEADAKITKELKVFKELEAVLVA